MEKLFGASWVTSLIGYLAGGLVIVNEMVTASGFPKDKAGWVNFIFGVLVALLGRNAKDSNKSNAPSPVMESRPVV